MELKRPLNFQCWIHECPNLYDGDGNDDDDWSFHYKLSFSLREVLEEEENNFAHLENYSRRSCKPKLSLWQLQVLILAALL